MRDGISVFVLHNMPAPYRLPLFQELANHFDINVCFCEERSRDRFWKVPLKQYSFRNRILKNLHLGPFVLNYSLPFELIGHKYDAYIISDNVENLLSSMFLFLIAKLHGKALIIWSGHIETTYFRIFYPPIGRFLEILLDLCRKFVYPCTDTFIAYSKMTRDFLLRRGVQKQRIFVGTQVIARPKVPQQLPSKSEMGFGNKKVVLYLGYFKRQKGIEYLIMAFKNLHRTDAVLAIVGAGPIEEELRAMAKSEETIRFFGYVDGEDKYKYYSVADVFVLPTLHDSWGLVINEAMYFGLPVIATNAAAAVELIKDNGVVVEGRNVNELAEALRTLLDNEKLRRTMGEKSRKYIEKHDIQTGVEPFIRAVKKAVHSERTYLHLKS